MTNAEAQTKAIATLRMWQARLAIMERRVAQARESIAGFGTEYTEYDLRMFVSKRNDVLDRMEEARTQVLRVCGLPTLLGMEE